MRFLSFIILSTCICIASVNARSRYSRNRDFQNDFFGEKLSASENIESAAQDDGKKDGNSGGNGGSGGSKPASNGGYASGGTGKGKQGLSNGAGLRQIAEGSADQANQAVQNQHAAALQASFVAKNTLAQSAALSSGTAQAALAGKQILLQGTEQQARDAKVALDGETQQLMQAQRAANAAQQAAQQATQQVNIITSALNAAQATADHTAQAASEAAGELAAQRSMVGSAKQRLITLQEQLVGLRLDFEVTQAAAQQAMNSAQQAQASAAAAAAAAAAAQTQPQKPSAGHYTAEDGGSKPASNGGYASGGTGKGKQGLSNGAGLRQIAEGSADQANQAVQNQHAAALQASFVAKNTLAQSAALSSGTAQAALAGKQILLQGTEQQARDAKVALDGETQQLMQAQRAANAAQQASQQATQQVNIITSALNAAQATADHTAQAASEAAGELAAQRSMVGSAKQRLITLQEQLVGLRLDFEVTQAAAQQAMNSAQQAQASAAAAAAAAAAAQTQPQKLSAGHYTAEDGYVANYYYY